MTLQSIYFSRFTHIHKIDTGYPYLIIFKFVLIAPCTKVFAVVLSKFFFVVQKNFSLFDLVLHHGRIDHQFSIVIVLDVLLKPLLSLSQHTSDLMIHKVHAFAINFFYVPFFLSSCNIEGYIFIFIFIAIPIHMIFFISKKVTFTFSVGYFMHIFILKYGGLSLLSFRKNFYEFFYLNIIYEDYFSYLSSLKILIN